MVGYSVANLVEQKDEWKAAAKADLMVPLTVGMKVGTRVGELVGEKVDAMAVRSVYVKVALLVVGWADAKVVVMVAESVERTVGMMDEQTVVVTVAKWAVWLVLLLDDSMAELMVALTDFY